MSNNIIVIETFDQFVTHGATYAHMMKAHGHRSGQALFNLLARIRPDISEMLRGSDMDPFHRDERLPDFYDFVARHW